MRKKILIVTTITATLFGALLVVLNYHSFITATNRLKQIFNIEELKCFFEKDNPIFEEAVNEINDGITSIINDTFHSGRNWQQQLQIMMTRFLNFTINLMLFIANIGINFIMLIYLYFSHNFSTSNPRTNYSMPARIYRYIIAAVAFPIALSVKGLRLGTKWIKKHKRAIFLTCLFLLFCSSILYQIIVETIIFLVAYIYHSINQDLFPLLSSLFQYLIATIYPYLKRIPWSIWVMLIPLTMFLYAVTKAEKRLVKNHSRFKAFVKDQLTQTTFLNGPPGVGKTLLNLSCSLASEENFIEELEGKMMDYQIRRPKVNFAKVRANPENYPEFREYANFLLLLNRGSLVISNYSIYSPYFREYCKIFDFDYMRKNKKVGIYPLEEYIVISLSELDKEYNSHDDKQKVGADGAATFFSTVSHDLKRHTKIFCDYQLKDQVPLRIRGNSEYFYTIKKRKKKYPFLLSIYYRPIQTLSRLVRKLIKRYETTRPYINKKTKRRTVSTYKRNDSNLLYLILRQSAYALDKISDWFDHYWYFKMTGDLSQQDGATGEEKKINLNICDLSIENMALYDSTFLSYAYEQKKNAAFASLRKFTSLTPSIDELTACHSQFYDKINGLADEQSAAETKNKGTNNSGDEYYEVSN